MKNNYLLCGISGLAALAVQPCMANKTVQEKDKPNFIVIITDDQTYETLRSLNTKEISTPNMDRLVRNGTTFTHTFNQGSWSGAVSVASRSMLITGQNVINAQKTVEPTTPAQREEAANVKLLGEVFGEAGYETFVTGKWHNSDKFLLRSFQAGEAVGTGFYETTDENGSADFAYRRPNGSDWTPWNTNLKGHWSPTIRNITDENGEKKASKPYTVNQHTSELYTDCAIRYLEKEHTKPFFMYVAFNAPHDPRQSPKEFVDMYPQERIKIPENYLPEHPFDLGIRNMRDELLAPYPRTEETVRIHRQEYYAIISHFDKELGRLLDRLESTPYKNNTYIIFTSDHGLAVGMHGLMGKQNMYDHSMRVPFIVTGPDIRKNQRIDAMIYMQNIFATTCDYAGIPVPNTVDYQSIRPLLEGKQKKGEEYIFGYYKNVHRMIRSDRYKLIVYPAVKEVQLFDLKKDPYEVQNLAYNKKYAKIRNEMFDVLKQKQDELGDNLSIDFESFKGF